MQNRQQIVNTIFPQLAYLCANIIIYVGRGAIHEETYVRRLEEFTAKSTATEGSGEKPMLIIVQNFENPCQQKDPETSYDLVRASNDFYSAHKNSPFLDKLNQYYYGGINVIKLPEHSVAPTIYERQLTRLKVSL
jgi:hypothetical protein